MDWTTLLGTAVFVALFAYLGYALMHPERF
jgi:K+-transporting ATPase KdpF subunit